jgi:HK97 family phage major capsid protein
MDPKMEVLLKEVHDLQERLTEAVKANGASDGHVKMDAILQEQFAKNREAILVEIDKKLAEKKAIAEPPKQPEIRLGDFLKMVKVNHPDIVSGKYLGKTVMNEGTPAQGGYTVPTGYDSMILGALNDVATIPGKVTMFPHGDRDGFTKNIPKWLTDLTVAWVNEASDKGSTKPTLTYKQSILKKIAAIIPFSDEYLEDDISNMAQQVSTLVGENFNMELERSILVGNSDPFIGWLYAVGVNSRNQAAANLGYADLVGAWNEEDVLERQRVGSEWFMNRHSLSLIMALVDLSGRPLWNIQSINGAMVNTLLGDPIDISSVIPSTLSIVGAGANESAILYGNPKNILMGYKVGNEGVQVDISNQAVINTSGSITENYWQQDLTGYRFVVRRSVIVGVPEALTKIIGVK